MLAGVCLSNAVYLLYTIAYTNVFSVALRNNIRGDHKLFPTSLLWGSSSFSGRSSGSNGLLLVTPGVGLKGSLSSDQLFTVAWVLSVFYHDPVTINGYYRNE